MPGSLLLAGFEVESASLPVGDYILSERVAVERKSAQDFTASLKDGRLFEQAERLRSEFSSALLLVEGRPRLAANVVDGTIASLLRHGISVLRVANSEESIEWLLRLARQEARDNQRPRIKGPRKASLEPEQSARHSLAVLPGISAVKAERLLKHFGSLAAVANASPNELAEVEGIGKLTSKNLNQIFSLRYGEVPF